MNDNSKPTTLRSDPNMSHPLLRATRAGAQLNLAKADPAPYPVRSKATFIQWPSERDIEQVSRSLARIVQVGIWSEAKGDHFKSGDLAYQIQEIIRATDDLVKKCKRASG